MGLSGGLSILGLWIAELEDARDFESAGTAVGQLQLLCDGEGVDVCMGATLDQCLDNGSSVALYQVGIWSTIWRMASPRSSLPRRSRIFPAT